MQALFIGDIFGKPGLRVAEEYLERFGERFDFVIANGENAAGGYGITRKNFEKLLAAGVDVVTMGNHTWDQAEVVDLLEETPRLLRPLNYPPGTPGLGQATFEARNGERVTVAQAMGRVYMDPLDDPFRAVDAVVEGVPAGESLIFDFHAEATSEKKVMGYHLAGRASAVIGTHTHVQTADELIVDGTAYITDVGMSGVQFSSLGMNFEEVHHRFVTKLPRRYRPADRPGTLCGLALVIEAGRTKSLERIQWHAEAAEE